MPDSGSHPLLDKPDDKRETTPNPAPTEPPFAFGSGGRWALTFCSRRNEDFCTTSVSVTDGV